MKRWVLLGLVGLLGACKDGDSSPAGTDCVDTAEQSLPPQGLASLSSSSSALSSNASQTDDRKPFIVRYRRTVSAESAAQSASDAVTRAGGVVKARWARIGAVAARMSDQERADLTRDPDVLSIAPDREVHAFTRQPVVTTGSVGEYTSGLKLVQAPSVWDANNDGVLDTDAPNGSGIKVCVIDSGWDNRQPELKAAYAGGKDFVDNDNDPLDIDADTGLWGGGHGTHTAATILAQMGSAGTVSPGDDPNGVVGVAPGAELLVARVLNAKGNGSTSAIISALDWCQGQGAKIVSLSLGASEPDEAERTAFTSAIQSGIIAVAASGNGATGNEEDDENLGIAYPARYTGMVSVGAVNFNDERAPFSQLGPELTFVGPGVDVLSAVIVGSQAYSQVTVNGKTYESNSLEFAPSGDYSGTLLKCGVGDSRDSCGKEATCDGFVAYVDRGGTDETGAGLTFAKKVEFMRRAGARAVIIGNNDPNDGVGRFTLGGNGTWLPAAAVSNADANDLKSFQGATAEVKLIGVDYARLSGTSMATPHVSGVAALVWSARPSLKADEVIQLLKDSAKPHGSEPHDDAYGYGLVQAKAALDLLHTRYPSP